MVSGQWSVVRACLCVPLIKNSLEPVVKWISSGITPWVGYEIIVTVHFLMVYIKNIKETTPGFRTWKIKNWSFFFALGSGFFKIYWVLCSGFRVFSFFLWNRSRVCGFKPGADFWDRVGPGWLIFPPGWTRAGSVRQAVLDQTNSTQLKTFNNKWYVTNNIKKEKVSRDQ